MAFDLKPLTKEIIHKMNYGPHTLWIVKLDDATLEVLARQAICEAKAGVDIIGPSDMMDGRVGYIRNALDNEYPSNSNSRNRNGPF